MKKGIPIGGLRAVGVNQELRVPRQIEIRLSNQNIQLQGELEEINRANDHQEIRNANQEENNVQGQDQQVQIQNDNHEEEQIGNRRSNRSGNRGQRGSGRSNERNRMDLE